MSTLQKNRVGQLFPGSFREFDTLVNHFFRGEGAEMWHAPATISEAENTFHIELDAPGVAKEDVELTFDKGTLQISLERKVPEGERTNWHNGAASAKSPQRLAADTVDPDDRRQLATAFCHVTITKRPNRHPRRSKSK